MREVRGIRGVRIARGFTYVGVLLAMALVGLALAAASEVWTKTTERQRRVELDWIGRQYVQAIGSYYEATPGFPKSYPNTVADLLEDRRAAFIRRHLRQAYPNPTAISTGVTPVSGTSGPAGLTDWEVIPAETGGFRGVRAILGPGGDSGMAPGQIEFIYDLAAAR